MSTPAGGADWGGFTIPAHTKPQTIRHRQVARTAIAVAAVGLAAVAGLADTGRHTVRSGETLGRIARQYGTSAQAIAAVNGITNLNLIVVGQSLIIPAGAAPAPAAGAPAPAAPEPSGTVHVVREGDTLFEIAQRYDTTVDALIQVNGIANRRLIHPGDRVAIPAGGATAAAAPAAARPAPSGTVHTVRSGETLGRIARRYGTSAQAIAALNGITNLNLVRSGARLAIPAAPAASSPLGAGVHVVQPGETLASVAARYGLSPDVVAAANGLTPPYTLYVGNRLFLASQNAAPAPGLAACPVPGGTFFNDYGFPRPGGRFHNGIDLFAPMNTPVLAPVSGRVQHLSGPLGGNQFILRGDDGNRYAGSHLSAFGAGGRVAAGTVIGYVGNTGNAIGGQTHLHFEIRPGGGANVNPFSALDAAC